MSIRYFTPDYGPRGAFRLPRWARFFLVCAGCLGRISALSAVAPHAELQTIPAVFLEQHCIECHGGKTTKGDLDLVKQDNYFSALLSGIVQSDPFRLRRGTDVATQAAGTK